MNISRNVVTEQEQRELIELARKACAMFGRDDSPESLEWVLGGWRIAARIDGVSVLDAGKETFAEIESEDKVNAEATTCRERRKALAARMDFSLEEYEEDFEAWGLHEDELFWLQERTGEKNAVLDLKIHQQQEYEEELLDAINALEAMNDPTPEAVEHVALLQERCDALAGENHKAIARESQRLERKLLLMTLKARKPAIFRPYLKARTPSFRRPRAPRRSRRSAAVASRGGGDDGGGGDSDQSAPPRPRLLPVLGTVTLFPVQSCNAKTPWRRRRPGPCRMARRLLPAPRSRHGCIGPP